MTSVPIKSRSHFQCMSSISVICSNTGPSGLRAIIATPCDFLSTPLQIRICPFPHPRWFWQGIMQTLTEEAYVEQRMSTMCGYLLGVVVNVLHLLPYLMSLEGKDVSLNPCENEKKGIVSGLFRRLLLDLFCCERRLFWGLTGGNALTEKVNSFFRALSNLHS